MIFFGKYGLYGKYGLENMAGLSFNLQNIPNQREWNIYFKFQT